MDFFEEVDALGVAEASTQKLERMNVRDQQRIIETYKAVRDELRAKLSTWSRWNLRDRYTAQKLRGTLLQVEHALERWEGPLMKVMKLGVEDTSMFAVESLVEEIERYDDHFTGAVTPINLDAARIAGQHQNFLIEQYTSSFRHWGETTSRQIEKGLLEAIVRQDTNEQVITRLLQTFDSYEWQLRRIVRTEMHNVFNVSKIKGMYEARETYTPDLMKCLYHPLDHRTGDDSKALAKLNPIIPIDKPFAYTWVPGKSKKEYYRQFMAPPDRPNDRAVLLPYRESWGTQNKGNIRRTVNSMEKKPPKLTGS